ARWTEDHFGARRDTPARVRGEIALAIELRNVGFDFDDPPSAVTMNQQLPEQAAGHIDRRLGVEIAGQHREGANRLQRKRHARLLGYATLRGPRSSGRHPPEDGCGYREASPC